MSGQETVMAQLRTATHEHHQRLEALPFAQALAQGKLPLHGYVGYLRALAIIHGVLEGELSRAKEPAVAAVWNDAMRKLPLLLRDLASFEDPLIGDVPGAWLPPWQRPTRFGCARPKTWIDAVHTTLNLARTEQPL